MLAIGVFSLILFTSGIVGMMPPVFAQPAVGDIIVSDDTAGIIKVDPAGDGGVPGSAQTIISPTLNLVEFSFTGIAIDASGNIIASSIGAIPAIIKVNPTTGAKIVISSGGSLSDPAGIAIAANGDIIVANVGFPTAIFKVDPTTGAQTIISSGVLLGSPNGIAIAANGDIIVSDFDIGNIIKVDPTTGTQTLITSPSFPFQAGGPIGEAGGIRIAANGDIIVAGSFPAGVFKVDPTTGAQTTISSGGDLLFVTDVAIAANDDIIVTDLELPGIIKVDPTTGAQTIISSAGSFGANVWLTIFPSLVFDNDGISDDVDLQPFIFSDDFSDVSLGGVTTGTIITRGDQILTVEDDPVPANGVRITASASGGSSPAEISTCGGISTTFLTQNVQVIITCGV